MTACCDAARGIDDANPWGIDPPVAGRILYPTVGDREATIWKRRYVEGHPKSRHGRRPAIPGHAPLTAARDGADRPVRSHAPDAACHQVRDQDAARAVNRDAGRTPQQCARCGPAVTTAARTTGSPGDHDRASARRDRKHAGGAPRRPAGNSRRAARRPGRMRREHERHRPQPPAARMPRCSQTAHQPARPTDPASVAVPREDAAARQRATSDSRRPATSM